ncbi:hypothetical protein OA668_02515 [Candidatus Pelagibacter sp.]|nr:hypothetical protein [Candidatus Pelagibacter sp.]
MITHPSAKNASYFLIFFEIVTGISNTPGTVIILIIFDFGNIEYLLDYFENFNEDLSKKTLNSFLKSVSNP